MPIDVEKEMAALGRMTAGQLLERFAELFGETTQSRNRIYLMRKILWKLQANEMGPLSDRARKRAEELAKDAEFRVMMPAVEMAKPVPVPVCTALVSLDARLPPPGTALSRIDRPTCHLQRTGDGSWRGQWLEHERMPIEFIPLEA